MSFLLTRRLARIMKLLSIFLLTMFLQAYADGFAQNVTLSCKNLPLEKVFNIIEKQTDYVFFFDKSGLREAKKVTLDIKDQPIGKVLDACFAGQPMGYTIQGKVIVVTLKEKQNISASFIIQPPVPSIAITGHVVDSAGSPIEGASVTIKGTTAGTATRADGGFSLESPRSSGTLVISYVGFVTQEVSFSGNADLRIVLKTLEKIGENVVVSVGYGVQRRGKVTAAISSVPMQEIKDMPVSNVATALQGKIPGVVVQQGNGAPGSTPSIKIRGLGSISAGNTPLIVIDGNITSSEVFALLNSDDIESIDVLKDASSAAIYGSKGANGVMMVTTRKGKSGTSMINFNAYTGVQQVTKKIDLLNSQQFADFAKEASNNAYLDRFPNASVSDPNNVRPASNLRYRYPRGEGYDWLNFDDPAKIAALPYHNYQDLIFRNAMISNYALSFSGGTDKLRYFINGAYLDQEGVIKNSTLKRYSIRINVDANVSPRLKVGMNILPVYRVANPVNTDGHWANNGVINSALAVAPMAPIYAADGVTYSSQTAIAPLYNWPGITNPVANITEYHNTVRRANVLANAYAEYNLFSFLTYRVSGNVNFSDSSGNNFRTSKMPLNQLLPPTTATGSTGSSQGVSWLFNQTLTYNKTFAEDHNVNVLLGMESTKYSYQTNGGGGSAFPNDLVETINASANGPTTTATASVAQNSSVSYFARATYAYRSKYLLNVSVRRDGSSIFGPDHRWGTFPAVSAGWRIIEEPFLKNVNVLSEAKFRASYGLSGNNAFNSFYPYASLLQASNYVLNNGLGNGVTPSSPANPNLSWEKNQQVDAGLDVGLFNNRVYITVDYYRRVTKDLLLAVNVPTITGFSTVVQNIGKMQNKGWEFSVTSTNIKGAFVWRTNANLSLNRNKVLALGPNGDPIRSGSGVGETNITMIGQPIGSYFGYQQLGVFKDQSELSKHAHDPTSKPGDVIYADIDHNDTINANDRTVIGNNQPKFIYGFTNTFSYKGFDLNIAIQGVYGNKIFNLSKRFIYNMEGSQNQTTKVLHRWRSPSDPGDGMTPRANAVPTGNNSALSSRFIENGSYLRCQNITLGYTLPREWLNRAKLKQVRIYLSGQNLFTITKYSGYNPEVSGYEQSTSNGIPTGGALTGGVDYGVYPLARSYTVGINLGF
ncbi:MAG: TonB-dependent receptor [Chitinophagaceae bacterium]|nr:TonB-dependent receptor [Chitinophagaceae bacterium]